MTSSLRLAAFVLALVGGVLGLVDGLRPALRNTFAGLGVDILLLLLGGFLAVLGAVRGWRGQARDGGVLAIVGGVLLLLAGSELGGALALVGGVLYVVE